jgi:ABC-type glycerol-3-phosphate transport system substrate-binding protein
MSAIGDTTPLGVRLIVLIISVSLAACAIFPSASAPAVSTLVASTPSTGAPTRLPTSIPVAATRPAITTTNAITLTWWTTEEFAPSTTPNGRLIKTQVDAFTATNPNIRINVVLKKPYGKGGLLDFLTTTNGVLPNQMPDLVTLGMAEAQTAANAGLVQPLDGLLGTEFYSDFYPFVTQASRVQSQWISVPFAVTSDHLVYNKTTVKKAPTTWEEFLKQKGTLALPLGDENAFLVQYLAISSIDASSTITLDLKTTTEVLTFFKRSRESNLIPENSIGFKSTSEAWTPFVTNQVAMAQVSTSRYLADRAKVANADYAPVPTRDGKIAAIVNGWSLSVVAKDSVRQTASARFMQWMVQGDHLAPWLKATRYLPATRSTVALTIDPPDYATFLRDQLERASYVPPTSYAKASDAWRAAMTGMWKNQTTPEETARTMLNALK